jgi:glutathione S-transferase
MKLYDCTPAPSPRRARIFIAEKGLDIEQIEIDLGSGEHLQAAFQAINPACTVPVLELDDGTYISENLGIATYLEAAYPEPPLLGTTPKEKGLIAAWNARLEFEGIQAISEALRNRAKSMDGRAITGSQSYAQIPELAERGRARTVAFLDMLNQRLSDRDYVAIDQFSLADITAFVAIDFARWVKVEPDAKKHMHLINWYERVAQRPSARA